MSAGAGTQKGASGGVGVMSVSGTSLWLEKGGAGTVGSRYGGFGHRPGIPPVEHHRGASFLRPANFCHNSALRLNFPYLPFVRVSRCFLAGFIVGVLPDWEGGEVQA